MWYDRKNLNLRLNGQTLFYIYCVLNDNISKTSHVKSPQLISVGSHMFTLIKILRRRGLYIGLGHMSSGHQFGTPWIYVLFNREKCEPKCKTFMTQKLDVNQPFLERHLSGYVKFGYNEFPVNM